MRSLFGMVVVGGCVVGGVKGAVLRAPDAMVTPVPAGKEVVDLLVKRQSPDAVSLAQVLLTAIPESLREIAATNLPAVSSILWAEFLDDNKPEWFLELPKDIQDYLIIQFGPRTAWPTDPPASSGDVPSASASPTDATAETSQWRPSETGTSATDSATDSTLATSVGTSSTGTSGSATSKSPASSSINSAGTSTSSSTSDPDAPPAGNAGLSKSQKIGVGVGVPLALLAAAAIALGCCFLLRRRRKKHVDGSQPPSSPGFIPRFAFQEKSAEHMDHRTPLTRDLNHSTHDVSTMNWDDDVIDHADPEPIHHNSPTPMMHDPKPIMAPALYHTHSSNRARGKRTSYTSLHSVAEVSEPEDVPAESPVLGRHTSPKASPGRNLIPAPGIPAAAQIKRKPVPTSPPTSPAADAAAQTLRRQTMPDHSGSSSSGLALSGFNSSSSSGLGRYADAASPISPVSNSPPKNPFSNDHSNCPPKNPFSNDYSYVEDYGPEYNNGYIDVDDSMYGGNTSLSRYPEPRRKSFSKTEWPLRNMVGSSHKRNKSPLWDRIYEE